MPDYDSNTKQYVRNARTIGSHLNQGTIKNMIADIMKQGAKNVIEVAILNQVNTNKLSTQDAAREIKDDNFLSQGGYQNKTPLTQSTLAVCHKISFKSFDSALVALMNYELDATKTVSQKNSAWAHFENLLGVLYPPHGYTSAIAQDAHALRTQVSTSPLLACSSAHDILLQFDASDQNLYFGFQDTNASISYRADFHYDINSAITSTGVAVSTPRGPLLLDSLNALEKFLGLKQSFQDIVLEYVASAKVKWVKTSGLDSQGWVEAQ